MPAIAGPIGGHAAREILKAPPARRQHLAREKELTRLRDRLSQERRALPWVKVDTPYVFDGPTGRESPADLFEGRRQLVAKGRDEAGLPSSMDWLRHHDRYEDRPIVPARGLSRPGTAR
jgi:predicted dithiol-disulfide oxidoreductase (DUF899 family)